MWSKKHGEGLLARFVPCGPWNSKVDVYACLARLEKREQRHAPTKHAYLAGSPAPAIHTHERMCLMLNGTFTRSTGLR